MGLFNFKKAFDTKALVADIDKTLDQLGLVQRVFASRVNAGVDTEASALANEYIKRSITVLGDCAAALEITLPPKDKRKLDAYIKDHERILAEINSACVKLGNEGYLAEQTVLPLALELSRKQRELASIT